MTYDHWKTHNPDDETLGNTHEDEGPPEPDFVAHFDTMSTVWRVTAETDRATDFAENNFHVEDWQGEPTDFYTDWRPARDLCRQLASDGFVVACSMPGRPGYGYMEARR